MSAFKPSSRAPALFRRNPRRPLLPLLLVGLLVLGAVGGGYLLLSRRSGGGDPQRIEVVRACDVPVEILERVWRGYVPGRTGDVLTIEQLPNQYNTRHSTPFPYTQDVPLVLYGPGFIKSGVTSDRTTTVADLAPTFAELLDFELPTKVDGRPLREALLPKERRNGLPKLIFTLVWDGGGDNVLEFWPESWPQLKSLMKNGTKYTEATVGSSPSITPSIHATIGTGVFPKKHGLSDTRMRIGNETLDAYEGGSPKFLRVETLGDLWDRANGNMPLVGMMARDNWHLGMIGHGAFSEGGDRDIAVMDDLGEVEFRTSEKFYELPDYLLGNVGLQEAIDQVDQRDGEADQRWLGNPLLPIDGKIRYTPAWSIFQTDKLKQLLTNEGFGADEVPDLFFVNYKSTDLAGHEWNMVELEEKETLEEQDRQIEELLRFLDDTVGRKNYVLAMTADHGMTPYPEETGGWNIIMSETSADIEKKFDKVTPDVPLILSNRGYQIMLNKKEVERNNVDPADIAAFLRTYTIGDNAPNEQALGDFENRTEERVFTTALTPEELKEALDCARTSA
ncbi:MAG: alkaline phosphatase family protein [Actinomycetota bacterium]|nr:alkaline phosphatase family protein [Actinomycetota bacterium]